MSQSCSKAALAHQCVGFVRLFWPVVGGGRREGQFFITRERMSSVSSSSSSSSSWAPFSCVAFTVAVGSVGVVVATVYVGLFQQNAPTTRTW